MLSFASHLDREVAMKHMQRFILVAALAAFAAPSFAEEDGGLFSNLTDKISRLQIESSIKNEKAAWLEILNQALGRKDFAPQVFLAFEPQPDKYGKNSAARLMVRYLDRKFDFYKSFNEAHAELDDAWYLMLRGSFAEAKAAVAVTRKKRDAWQRDVDVFSRLPGAVSEERKDSVRRAALVSAMILIADGGTYEAARSTIEKASKSDPKQP